MTKTDRLTDGTDILDTTVEYLDVQNLADKEVADVAGGPEVINTGGEF